MWLLPLAREVAACVAFSTCGRHLMRLRSVVRQVIESCGLGEGSSYTAILKAGGNASSLEEVLSFYRREQRV
ncbi:hypothetical protein B296_00056410 [Ensete ventricosum]|uniref:Uncharacterized protein n=1 Tax=Ensete ventricosum TaxID=4639 RepID=A0A426WVR6_ENSVE|nr:hypothetical protein B296_00056410 [Ensete ventricosum]